MVSLLRRLRGLLPGGAGAGPPDAVPATELTWLAAPARTAAMACPNCGAIAAKLPVLGVAFTLPGEAARRDRLLRCADCTCLFYEDRRLPDYAADHLRQPGRVSFYLQQGAGVGLLAGVLAQVAAPPGAAYVEVGCGFGLALDFAVWGRGWVGLGIDPGGLAAIGSARLGLPIEPRYLGSDEPALSARFDVAMSAETIEHVASPPAFLRVLRGIVRPGGVLVLTTPDAAALRAETASGALVALLSPGYHMVFQTAESLCGALRAAGFPEVVVRADGYGLVAHASDRPFRLETDPARLGAAYLDYLERRVAEFAPGDDLQLGFAARLLQECVNRGQTARAGAAYAALRAACLGRFGLDLDRDDPLPEEALRCDLERLTRIMPLALGGILHADAIRRLADGTPRAALEARFLRAAEAADVLRAALRRLGTDDAMSEEIAWAARAEALLCAASGPAEGIADRLLALAEPPRGGAARRAAILARAVVVLVNAGRYAPAREVAAVAGLQDEAAACDRDALFCLAVLDVRGDDPAAWPRGARRFARVRVRAAEDAPGLFWAALRGEAMALERLGQHGAVAALLAGAAARADVPADLMARAADLAVPATPPQ